MLFHLRQPSFLDVQWVPYLSALEVCSRQGAIYKSTFTLPYLSSPAVVWWLWKQPVNWWWDGDADFVMERVTADARSDHHWQPQPKAVTHLMKFATALLTCSWGSSFQMVCRATFNSTVVLGFSWSYILLFQHSAP